MDRFTKDNVKDSSNWKTYRKQSLTRAKRVIGRFEVETDEDIVTCQDGWVAIDSRGYPYPIPAAEFDNNYKLSPDDSTAAVLD